MHDVAQITHRAREMHFGDLAEPAKVLFSPYTVMRRESALENMVGAETFTKLKKILLSLLQRHDLSQYSVQCLLDTAHDNFGKRFLAFLRGSALCFSARHSFSPQVVHVLNALLYEGFIGDSILLDGELMDRGVFLSRALLKTAQEYGSDALLYLGLGVMQAIDKSVTLTVSKQITLAIVKSERRKLDWALKASKGKNVHFTARRGW